MTLPTTLRRIGPLTIALTLALGANFAYSAWSQPDPGVVPPDGNTAPPIDVSKTPQDKKGPLSIGGSLLVGGVVSVPDHRVETRSVWSTEYCDENGENCTTSGGLGGDGTEGTGASCTATIEGSTTELDHMQVVAGDPSCGMHEVATDSYALYQCNDGTVEMIDNACEPDFGSADP